MLYHQTRVLTTTCCGIGTCGTICMSEGREGGREGGRDGRARARARTRLRLTRLLCEES